MLFLVSFVAHSEYRRSVVNFSSKPWTVSFTDATFSLFSLNCPYTPICTLQPGESVMLISFPHTSSSILFLDENKKGQSFIYTTIDRTPYIKHSGRTGSVVLNEPRDGDVVIQGDVWE